jgi:hypothetical protein
MESNSEEIVQVVHSDIPHTGYYVDGLTLWSEDCFSWWPRIGVPSSCHSRNGNSVFAGEFEGFASPLILRIVNTFDEVAVSNSQRYNFKVATTASANGVITLKGSPELPEHLRPRDERRMLIPFYNLGSEFPILGDLRVSKDGQIAMNIFTALSGDICIPSFRATYSL